MVHSAEDDVMWTMDNSGNLVDPSGNLMPKYVSPPPQWYEDYLGPWIPFSIIAFIIFVFIPKNQKWYILLPKIFIYTWVTSITLIIAVLVLVTSR